MWIKERRSDGERWEHGLCVSALVGWGLANALIVWLAHQKSYLHFPFCHNIYRSRQGLLQHIPQPQEDSLRLRERVQQEHRTGELIQLYFSLYRTGTGLRDCLLTSLACQLPCLKSQRTTSMYCPSHPCHKSILLPAACMVLTPPFARRCSPWAEKSAETRLLCLFMQLLLQTVHTAWRLSSKTQPAHQTARCMCGQPSQSYSEIQQCPPRPRTI